MSFLKKLFAPQHPLAPLRKAVQQRRWADALVEGELLAKQQLAGEDGAEMDRLLASAGDALAEMNLDEGEAFLRAGDPQRANEHFTLAAAQARHPRLAEKAQALLSRPSTAGVAPAPRSSGCCPTGCGESGPDEAAMPTGFDARTHLDLILASYPRDLAERYTQLGDAFLQGFLLAHEGRFADAANAFERVPEMERNDLFFYERGSLRACMGDAAAATVDFERALAINPNLEHAAQALVSIELGRGELDSAEMRLQGMVRAGVSLPFALGRLATIQAMRGDFGAALEHALGAMERGADPETVALAASLLEREGRLDEAEKCLSQLGTGGCGGLNLPLAEFWLRQQKHAEKALQTFKSALRQEPTNPRWMVRIAQAYSACGWGKEGLSLLQQALQDDDLEPQLRAEALSLMEGFR